MSDMGITYKTYGHFDKPCTYLGRWFMLKLWCDMVRWSGIVAHPLLEIGPGRGHVGVWCQDNDCDYHALEACTEQVVKLNALGLSCEQAFVPPVIAEKKYRTAVLLNVLEHMPAHDKALQLLIDLREKALLHDGHILISVPQFEGYDFYRNVFDHSYPCTRERLRMLLKAAGYRLIDVEWHSFVFNGWIAWLWSRIGRILPLELPAALAPHNNICRKIQKLSSFFALRIWCRASV